MKKLTSSDAGHIYELKQQISRAERIRQAHQLEVQAGQLALHPRGIFQGRVNRLRMMAEVLRKD